MTLGGPKNPAAYGSKAGKGDVVTSMTTLLMN